MKRKTFITLLVALATVGTAPAQEISVHTIGDSTMADYAENTTRTRGWGEMLQEFFNPKVRIVNYARGGRSSRSFCEEGLWDKVKQNLKPHDYVFIQFAHNDEKEGGKDGADFRGTAPWTTYKRYIEKYVDETRQLGGNPVLITPIVRRYFDKSGHITRKGCHDISATPDDSTLNYVRVMKHVAREKRVPLIDMTALTRQFVETLGETRTVKQIYVPTDGTHTQATGAACYARLAASALKAQGILSPYILTEIPVVCNPTSIDFGTVYAGDRSTTCIDLVGLTLPSDEGKLRLSAPQGMGFSTAPQGTPQRRIELPYKKGRLWNQELFLHFTPTGESRIDSHISLFIGTDTLRTLPVKAVGKQIAHRTEAVLTPAAVQLKGMTENGGRYTIESGTWPKDIDEDGKRYVEFVIRNGERTLMLKQLSFTLTGSICYRTAYARGKDFYPRTDVGEVQRPDEAAGLHTYPLNVTVAPQAVLHFRIFPWNTAGGRSEFRIEQVKAEGITVE